MRVVVQRVSEASVKVGGNIVGQIGVGLMVLVGIENADTTEDVDWLSNKIVQLRIFNDAEKLMNLNLAEVDGNILLISQFTLMASTRKGNRPSYIRASKPTTALPLYQQMIVRLQQLLNKPIATGVFGADMQVALINDGPVTIVMDSKNKE